MATPYSRSNSVTSFNAGPSRTLLHQLLEEITGAPTASAGRTKSLSQSPSSTWSSSHDPSPSVWVGGAAFAQDARHKLRVADEAHQRRASVNSADSTPGRQTPSLHLDTSSLQPVPDEYENGLVSGVQQTPDPVRNPHDYMHYMMKGSPLSTTVGLSPAAHGHDHTPFHLQAPHSGNDLPQPLSPLMFSDVDFDFSSSPLTKTTASPTEAPISAATVYTAEEPKTPSDVGSMHSNKRAYFFDDVTPEASPMKKRSTTMPDIGNKTLCRLGLGGDNRCVLRDDTFTERAPIPGMPVDLATSTALPELSSFRPNVASPPDPSALGPPVRTLARALTSTPEPLSPGVPDTPVWMRSFHLFDTGDKSIYMNAHDDGPIRHALCLYCFRRHGSFHKVHKHGYEACGRTEVLDSHYWESKTRPGESSDDSNSSED